VACSGVASQLSLWLARCIRSVSCPPSRRRSERRWSSKSHGRSDIGARAYGRPRSERRGGTPRRIGASLNHPSQKLPGRLHGPPKQPAPVLAPQDCRSRQRNQTSIQAICRPFERLVQDLATRTEFRRIQTTRWYARHSVEPRLAFDGRVCREYPLASSNLKSSWWRARGQTLELQRAFLRLLSDPAIRPSRTCRVCVSVITRRRRRAKTRPRSNGRPPEASSSRT
jgi:hypothetical protein